MKKRGGCVNSLHAENTAGDAPAHTPIIHPLVKENEMELTQEKVNKLIARRDKLLTRRDGLYDHAVVDRIDAQLAQVAPGQSEDVDYALGRVLPKSAARWSTDSERAEWQAHGAEETARAAQATQDEWLLYIADQHDDMMDFMQLCGNLAL